MSRHRSEVFFQAVQDGDMEQVRALLTASPQLALDRDKNGLRGVTIALYHRHAELVEFLRPLTRPLDIFEAAAVGDLDCIAALGESDPGALNATSSDGFTPLGLAAYFGRTEITALLLREGASPNLAAANRMGVFPIHSAAAAGVPDVALALCRLLVDFGADVNVAQHGGWTALHQAAARGHVELVRLLLAAGADSSAESDDGGTAASLAEKNGHAAVLTVLQERA